MSTQSDMFHSQKAEEWRATQKKGRLRYSLIYGSIWGAFMIFVKVLDIGVEDGLAALSWQLIYDEWIWIPFGILSFYTLFWWVKWQNIFQQKEYKHSLSIHYLYFLKSILLINTQIRLRE